MDDGTSFELRTPRGANGRTDSSVTYPESSVLGLTAKNHKHVASWFGDSARLLARARRQRRIPQRIRRLTLAPVFGLAQERHMQDADIPPWCHAVIEGMPAAVRRAIGQESSRRRRLSNELATKPHLRRLWEATGLLKDRTSTYSLTVRRVWCTITRSFIPTVLRCAPATVIPRVGDGTRRLD